MNIKTLSTLTLAIMLASVLSACDDDGDDNASFTTNSTVSSEATTTAPSSVETKDEFTLVLNGPNPQIVTIGTAFIDQGASSYSSAGEDLSSTITESNNVNPSIAGCYLQTYMVSDTSGDSKNLTRTVFVGNAAERHSPNSAPITEEVAITNQYNSSLTLDLLDYAFDADCDALSLTNVSVPDVGTAVINDDGTVTFDPLGNIGSHFFSYTVADAYGGSSTSGVSISSIDPNDGNDSWPEVNSDSATTAKNTSILIDVLANDSDADGDALVLDMVDSPANGTTQKQGGKVLYTPDVNFVGEDSFYYGVHDNHGHGGSNIVVITVTE